jgi:hypothetical protein
VRPAGRVFNQAETKESGSSPGHQYLRYAPISLGDEAMIDRDRAEMRALCDRFKELMQRQVEAPLFDDEALVRIGDMIGKAARQGCPDYVVLRYSVSHS